MLQLGLASLRHLAPQGQRVAGAGLQALRQRRHALKPGTVRKSRKLGEENVNIEQFSSVIDGFFDLF